MAAVAAVAHLWLSAGNKDQRMTLTLPWFFFSVQHTLFALTCCHSAFFSSLFALDNPLGPRGWKYASYGFSEGKTEILRSPEEFPPLYSGMMTLRVGPGVSRAFASSG